MEYTFSVEEATQKLFTRLSEAIGWKYLKSQRCLKKTVKDLVFQINFFSSKWNVSYERVEVSAEFKLWCKSYGKLPVDNVITMMPYCPERCTSNGEAWYDISTEEKLLAAFDELNQKIQQTAGSLCAQFEQDYLGGVECLFREHFNEYRVYLDFIADKLGMSPAIREKAQEIYDSLSDHMRQQVLAYQNGARDSCWMVNRSNLKYIVDNNLIHHLLQKA